jgi:hypothetical protein
LAELVVTSPSVSVPRSALPLLLATSALSGCSCSNSGAATPTPVTLVFTNSSSAPVFVDATDATFGLVITPQGSAVTAPPYLEALPGICACQSCDVICSTSGCQGAPTCQPQVPTDPLLELLPPGAAVQRTWSGVYQKPSQESCGALIGGEACLQQTNDFPDDNFTARICYALSVPGGQGADAGAPFPGNLPSGELVCATKDFQPQQGTVNLAPPPPMACTADAGSCPGGQLCVGGVCSSGCPENDFPVYGNGYFVSISTPSGPFFLQTSTATSNVASGTGTLTSVAYTGGTTFLALSSDAGLTGNLTFILPQLDAGCCLEAFHPGETLSVTVTETPPGSANRGLVIRDGSGQLIQAADMAANGPVLGAADTAPFTVTLSTNPLGCSSVDVGCKAVYAGTFFATPEGAQPLGVPGQLLNLSTSGANFGLLNVTNTSYQLTSSVQSACSAFTPLAPYLILNTRP